MLVQQYDLSFRVISVIVWPFLGTASGSWTDSYRARRQGCVMGIYSTYLLAFYLLPLSCKHLKMLPQEYK